MKKKIKIKINGRQIECFEGQTILEVVQENRLDEIPTLCHDQRLHPFGSCFVCVVEVKGLNKFVPSCCTPVSEGMEVTTNNKRISEVRRTALELLLSNHYADCLAPCKQRCPAGVDVQGYIALIAEGKYHDAIRLIKETNPLPLVCGRVCVRECEIACRRNLVDERVGIDYLKRYAADLDIKDPWKPELPAKNGLKVAVIGGGPAGLTAAYFLLLKGYEITIFEQMPHLGGMLRYGIPEYRLPKAVLDAEINWIIDLGVEVQLNKKLGKDFTLNSLKKEGFDAILLAIGAWQAKGMRLKGEESLSGVLPGITFLRQVVAGEISKLNGKVVVVGGGNTAIDAARTALRLGADEVTILYRRTRKEMPAHEMEIQAALDEGVKLIELAAPVALIDKEGRLCAVRSIRMELGAPDASGRRSPVPVEGSEFELSCDWIISAIGQGVEINDLKTEPELKLTRWETIQADEENFATSLKGVFAAGDALKGPAVAIDAIAHGKKAAEAIDRYLRPDRVCAEGFNFLSKKETFNEVSTEEYLNYPRLKKEHMPELPPQERIKSFTEVELGFTSGQVENETARCLECGCLDYFECKLRQYASEYRVELKKFVGETRRFEIDKRHPQIVLDANKCISCSKCIRLCSEIIDVTALGLVWRGFKSVMKPAGDKPLSATTCISCGNCIDICPTGAIEDRLPFKKPGPWKYELKAGICSECSINCQLNYKVYTSELYSICGLNDSFNRGLLCQKGRFSWQEKGGKTRLLQPEVKSGDRFKAVDLKTAITQAVEKTIDAFQRFGSKAVGIAVAPQLSIEEYYLLQKLSGEVLNLSSLESISAGKSISFAEKMLAQLPEFISTCQLEDLCQADLIITFDDLQADNLIAWLEVVGAQKNGARMINLATKPGTLAERADVALRFNRLEQELFWGLVLAEILKSGDFEAVEGWKSLKRELQTLNRKKVLGALNLTNDQFELIMTLIKQAQKTVVMLKLEDPPSAQIVRLIYDLLVLRGQLSSGQGLLLLSRYGNWEGLRQIRRLYRRPVSGLFSRLKKGELKVLWLFKEELPASWEPFLKSVQTIIYCGSHRPEKEKLYNLLLPWNPQEESSGSLLSTDLRWQKFQPALPAKLEITNLELIRQIAAGLGADFNYHSPQEVINELAEVHPLFNRLRQLPVERCQLSFVDLLS